jgi:hypothetical protein
MTIAGGIPEQIYSGDRSTSRLCAVAIPHGKRARLYRKWRQLSVVQLGF